MKLSDSYFLSFYVELSPRSTSDIGASGSNHDNDDQTRVGKMREYCQDEKFTARCPGSPNQAVIVKSAHYGRIHIGHCVKRDLGYLGCSADALPVLDAHCSGLPGGSCDVSVSDPTLKVLKPCPKDVTWHLEASFDCVEGYSSFSFILF